MDGFAEVHGGHRERIRSRIAESGLDRLQPHEVLEFLLYYAIPRQDVNQISHNLMDHFGSLQDVLRAEIPELMKVEGVGKRAALWIALVGECCHECDHSGAGDRVALENFIQVFMYACKIYRTVQPPCSMQICLDAASRILYQRIICESRAWGEPSTLRDALADVISTRCRNVMIIQFVGNMHADPEDYDKDHAREYAYTLGSAGCSLLDVVLVGDGGITSMRQLGFIPDHSALSRTHRMVCERYMENMPESGEMDMRDIERMEEENEFIDL